MQGAAYNYFYDALNRRRYKSYPTGTADEYFYDLGHQLLVDQGNSTFSQSSSVRMTDEYIWLGGHPVAIIRGNLTSAWVHQADNTGTCTRNGDAANCGIYFPVTDVIGKAVLMLNAAGRIAGTGEYDPFGHVNRVFIDAETPHPYNPADSNAFASFTQPLGVGLRIDARVFVDSIDLDRLGTSAQCEGVIPRGSADALHVIDGNSNAVLASVSGVGGLRTSPWVSHSSGKVNLAMTGQGHCDLNPQPCPRCIRQPCPGCPPPLCTATVCDHVTTTTTATGVVAGSYEYRRYETGQVPFWTPLRFPGQYYDPETDLAQNWNRFYDPSTGRFLEGEPMLLDPTDMQDGARALALPLAYVYADNNPSTFVDDTGLGFVKPDCASLVNEAIDTANRILEEFNKNIRAGRCTFDVDGKWDHKTKIKGLQARLNKFLTQIYLHCGSVTKGEGLDGVIEGLKRLANYDANQLDKILADRCSKCQELPPLDHLN